MKKIILMILLALPVGCAKKATVQAPGVQIVTQNDRIEDVLKSNLTPEQKVQVIHDILDREQNRGSNLVTSWKETLSWIAAIVTLAVTR